ncbi:DUF4114 domain-containing protein [Cellvibrio sp. UBA7661]|uniref:DUF4114 domain-containing protein n=1 Tax=Cellvibrio sp. UBA7661 TaxID=1946311 RepID=UPI002F351D63
MSKHLSVASAALCSCLALTAQAGPIPYPDVGSEASENSFVAAADGDISAYFFATGASYISRIGLWINGVSTGIYGLQNNLSAYGDSIVLGTASAGDALMFELQVQSTSSSWYSVAWFNSDSKNHTYATDFGGDSLIPMGTYVGFEDLPNLGDLDYNDHQFVFTNISTSVPEPWSITLFGLGLAALGAVRRRAS